MKTKKVNIYLTPLERKKLNDLKEKYHISYSTIANIVTEKIMLLINYETVTTITYEQKGSKTSIKPKLNRYENPTKLYTNCLKMFLNNEIKLYSPNQKATDKVLNWIYKEMTETYEPNYNGNYLNRILPRIVRANPKYYKKILESCED